MLHLVITRTKTNNGWVYGVCHFDENNFDKIALETYPEKALVELIKQGGVLENACLSAKGELKGTPAALSRLDTKPWLVLSRMCYENGDTVGYRIIAPDGQVRKCRNADVLAYCDRCERSGKVPFQNAIYHPRVDGTEAHIKSYPDKPFPIETLKRIVNKYAIPQPEATKPTQEQGTPKPEANKSIARDEQDIATLQPVLEKQADLFTPEQKKQLKLGIQNNVNIALYAHPEIDWQKMKVIRLAMQNGYDVKYLVNLDYIVPCTLDALMYMTIILAEGIDVRPFLNPRYTISQLSELHAGYVSFLDINQFANPDLTTKQMYEARTKLEQEQWGTPTYSI